MRENLVDARVTDWIEVGPETDFACRFELTDLMSDTLHHFVVDTADATGLHGGVRGRFRTAPTTEMPSDLLFCVMTCQNFHKRDHRDGHGIYPVMHRLKPAFLVTTGDNVYYDLDQPAAVTPELARYHWERIFSLPRLSDFYRQNGCYFAKDDHDTLKDDTWLGQVYGELDFARGQQIFREQVPIAGLIYRTYRWGHDVQFWLMEGRDFRSPNDAPDNHAKTIWGSAQKSWLKSSLLASDATWKILISPTPLVGPDREGKSDNHANPGFAHEGDEMRAWFQRHLSDHFFVICGDRHWQYHSVHPDTKLEEFSVGPASDAHAGGAPGEEPAWHRFYRVKGGFLTVEVRPESDGSRLTLALRDVAGTVVHSVEKFRSIT